MCKKKFTQTYVIKIRSKSRAPKSTAGLLGSRSSTLALLGALPGGGGVTLWGGSLVSQVRQSVFSYFARRRWQVQSLDTPGNPQGM